MKNIEEELVLVMKKLYIIDGTTIGDLDLVRTELIGEINTDIIENRDDADIVKSGLKLLEKVYSENYKYNERFLIEELGQYGVNVVKMVDIVDYLRVLETYFDMKVQCCDTNYKELKEKTKEYKDLILQFMKYDGVR